MTRRTLICAVAGLLLATYSVLAHESKSAEAIYATPIAFIAGHTRAVNYELGRHVPRDDTKAAKLYRVTAELGYAESQNDLARLYDLGRGVAQSNVQAYFWYTLAVEQGNTCAVHDRRNLAARMSPREIDEARTLVRARR